MTDEEEQGGHAKRVMASYEEWLGDGPEREILYLMGLFDRPAPLGAMDALRQEPSIPRVTEELGDLTEKEWKYALKRLHQLGLLAGEAGKESAVLDCHPLVREYFGAQLKKCYLPGWNKAHARLYRYYKNVPEKELPDTLEQMEPLFAAVAHGCAAAWTDINEAHEIITLGHMKLYLADYHLEAARLCLAEEKRDDAATHAGEAEVLIEEMEYFRRKGELEGLLNM